MPRKFLRSVLTALLLAGLLAAIYDDTIKAEAFANPAFQKVWNITDKPVADGVANRSFLWGPEGFATQTERYDNAPDGKRLVQYFDKGRMELTYPDANPNSAWYVNSGLLVRDLAGGLVQVGDNTVRLFDPAFIPLAGDSSIASNSDAPTYADFASEVFGRGTSSKVGVAVRDILKSERRRSSRDPKAQPQVNYAYYVPQSGHNIPAPFWEYFQQRGPVYSPKGESTTAPLFDWQFLMGYPITEPYWTTVKVAGKEIETLFQLFERRVLTYTPSNPEGYQVEMGNVGRHYYQWRYGAAPLVSQDTSLPASQGGTVYPKAAGLSSVFHLTSEGYKPFEPVSYTLTQPNGNVLEGRSPVRANQIGTVSFGLRASSFAQRDSGGLGVYYVNLIGEQTKKPVTIYLRIIRVASKTPTTPYAVDKSVPPSLNAIPDPAVGHIYTDFVALLNNFYTKDFAQNKVVAWVSDPYGGVFDIDNNALNLSLVDETLDGIILDVGGLPEPGIWAITFQSTDNSKKQSIVYLRGTEEPPEVTIGAALNILLSRSTAGVINQAIATPFKFGPGSDESGQPQDR